MTGKIDKAKAKLGLCFRLCMCGMLGLTMTQMGAISMFTIVKGYNERAPSWDFPRAVNQRRRAIGRRRAGPRGRE